MSLCLFFLVIPERLFSYRWVEVRFFFQSCRLSQLFDLSCLKAIHSRWFISFLCLFSFSFFHLQYLIFSPLYFLRNSRVLKRKKILNAEDGYCLQAKLGLHIFALRTFESLEKKNRCFEIYQKVSPSVFSLFCFQHFPSLSSILTLGSGQKNEMKS